jgi:cell division protein FtsZ
LPIQTAFKVADEILTNAVKGIAELITSAGLVNLDFADVKAVMSNGGVSLIGIGESDNANERAVEAVERAIHNPLLDVNIESAKGALVNIIGGPDMSLDEYKKVMERVSSKVAPDAKIISGAKISPDMEKNIKVLLIVTGVKSPQIVGKSSGYNTKGDNTSLGTELGINFIGEE